MQLDRPMQKMRCKWDISGLTNFFVVPVRNQSSHWTSGSEDHVTGLQHSKYGFFLKRTRPEVFQEGFLHHSTCHSHLKSRKFFEKKLKSYSCQQKNPSGHLWKPAAGPLLVSIFIRCIDQAAVSPTLGMFKTTSDKSVMWDTTTDPAYRQKHKLGDLHSPSSPSFFALHQNILINRPEFQLEWPRQRKIFFSANSFLCRL